MMSGRRGEAVLGTLLLGHIGHGEWFAGDGRESFFSLLLAGKLAAGGGKLGISIDGGEHPVRLRYKIVYFLLSVHDEGEGRGLHSSDAQHLSVLSVFQSIETGGIHAEYPVADGT